MLNLKTPLLSVKDLVILHEKESLFKNPLSFNINTNQLFILTGPSGTGKSSIMGAILNLVHHKGSIVKPMNYNFLTTNNALDEKETVMYNFEKYYQMFNIKVNWPLLKSYINVHETLSWNQRVDTLSFGTKRRIALYRVLHDLTAQILFLDEPTTGFDRENTERIIALFKDQLLATNKSYFVITHDPLLIAEATVLAILSQILLIVHKSDEKGYFKVKTTLKKDFEHICAGLKLKYALCFNYKTVKTVIYEVYKHTDFELIKTVLDSDTSKWRYSSCFKFKEDPINKVFSFYNA